MNRFLVCCIVFCLFSCSLVTLALASPNGASSVKVKKKLEQVPSVRTVVSMNHILHKWVNTSGVVSPSSLVSITSLTEGFVPDKVFEIGSIVKKGQSILKLGNKLLEHDLNRKKAIYESKFAQVQSLKESAQKEVALEVARARRDFLVAQAELSNIHLVYESKKTLGVSGMLAGQELQVAKSDFDKATANLDFLKAVLDFRLNLLKKEMWQFDIKRVESDVAASMADLNRSQYLFDSLNIIAPFQGKIVRRYIEEGNYVRTGANLFQIADVSTYYCDCYLDDRTLSKVKIGQFAELKFFDERKMYEGVVQVISPVADLEKGGHLVRVKLDVPSHKLSLGGYLSCRILLQRKQSVVALPVKSILSKESSPYVYVVTKEQKAVKQPVQLGIEEDGKIEVVSGLSVGLNVIVDGIYSVKDGQKVLLLEGE